MISISKMRSYMYDVVGAIHEVHGELGPGLNESCYQEGFQMELTEQGIPFLRELSFYPKYHAADVNELPYRFFVQERNYNRVQSGVGVDFGSSGAIVQLHATAEETLRHLGEFRTQVCYY